MKKLLNRVYRKNFVNELQNTRLSLQIAAMRKARELNQTQLGTALRMGQSRISEFESGEYSNWTLGTLRRIAAFFDVALVVHFDTFRNAVKNAQGVEINVTPGYEEGLVVTFPVAVPRSPDASSWLEEYSSHSVRLASAEQSDRPTVGRITPVDQDAA